MSPATTVEPCDFVVFGGTGDLAVRKLLPALYLRDRDGQLPAETRVIGASRAGLDTDGYRDKVRGELARFVSGDQLDSDTCERFLNRLEYVSVDAADPANWAGLSECLAAREGSIRVFYLACAPSLFLSLIHI